MAAPPLLLLTDIAANFGTIPLLRAATLSVSPGERLALVGRNGSGKSSLLRIAAGLTQADGGTRFVQPGATMRYLAQEPDLSAFATVEDYVMSGLGPADEPYRVHQLLGDLGLTGQEAPARLSGGEARRAALAHALAPRPDILLLDEPTNHLDLPAIEWLERELHAMRGALVLISHDRRFLERLSRAMVWLDRGTTRRLEQSFEKFEEWRDTVLEEEERDAHKLARQIVREEHWLRYGVTARRKRNVKRLGNLHALRTKHRERMGPQGAARLSASAAETSGNLVVEMKGVSKAFDTPVVMDFSTRIMRGDRVGIVGPNGAGKSTLLKLMMGELPADAGEIRRGTELTTVVLDQRRAELDADRTLTEVLTGGSGDQVEVGGQRRHVIGYMKEFLFQPEQARTPVRLLSGGERGRLLLARALAQPANLLVLDEPTNDLDLETLDLLQEMLAEHPGTVLVVSHDRDFLDRVATSVIAFEGEGRLAGICRRLLRHGDAARLWRAGRDPRRRRRAAARRPRRGPGAGAQAHGFPRPACPEDSAGGDGEAGGRDRRAAQLAGRPRPVRPRPDRLRQAQRVAGGEGSGAGGGGGGVAAAGGVARGVGVSPGVRSAG